MASEQNLKCPKNVLNFWFKHIHFDVFVSNCNQSGVIQIYGCAHNRYVLLSQTGGISSKCHGHVMDQNLLDRESGSRAAFPGTGSSSTLIYR